MIGRDAAAGAGPTVAKWEQLNLAPELLHSLTKFGCVALHLQLSFESDG